MTAMKRLYVSCPYCNSTFQSGFQAASVTQLIGLSYLCPTCRRIVPCFPSEYREKANDHFQTAMKEEEMFELPSGKRIEIKSPDVYELTNEIQVPSGILFTSDGAIINYRKKDK